MRGNQLMGRVSGIVCAVLLTAGWMVLLGMGCRGQTGNIFREDSMSMLEVAPEGSLEMLLPIPDKTVVLTFDDAVKSHRHYVAPLLSALEFNATFYITACWMDDAENFLSWDEVAEIHAMGFEIGNHSWTHRGFHTPENAEDLAAELTQVEEALAAVGVPRPVTFGWPGNAFGPEALAVLRESGYVFARRGMQPEKPYGEIHMGPVLTAERYDPLLIPTTGDAYPTWTLEHFIELVNQAKAGQIVVLQFHGVPDNAHPWVHTPPEMFAQFMDYLFDNKFHVIAMRDLMAYIDPNFPVEDPMVAMRYPEK